MLHRRPRSLVLVLLLGSTPAFADAQRFVVDEWFGEGEDIGVQVGSRAELIPERLFADVSFGEAISGGAAPIRFAIGLAWTPPPSFGSRRASPGTPTRPNP
jgi:hypothetical protein